MPLVAGSRVGPFAVVELLGSGGMGEVYRVRDERLGRDVALKVVPAPYVSDPARLARFDQEVRAASLLSHPNVVTIFDVGTHEGVPYVVTELLEGETLRQRIARGRLSAASASDVALQIARGLSAAHAKGIVHRDLKPENVFLVANGPVKILDFGLAKLMQPEPSGDASSRSTQTLLTEEGRILGTVGYMSPEQVRGEAVDLRTDVFAFGAILFEMLTGVRAFVGDTAVDTMSAILRDDPLASPARDLLPRPLERFVRSCLEKSPADRFQSARDVVLTLEALLGGGASLLRIPRLGSRRRRSLGALGAVALAGAAFWVFRPGGLVARATRDTPAAPAPTPASDAELLRNLSLALARSDGSKGVIFDRSYGTAGWSLVAFDLGGKLEDRAEAGAVAPDGTFVMAGTADASSTSTVWAVARMNPRGLLDATFGKGGKVTGAFGTGADRHDRARAVALQPDGKIVLAGSGSSSGEKAAQLAVVRLKADGTPDRSFGRDGLLALALPEATDGSGVEAVVVEPSGALLLAGTLRRGSGSRGVVARLQPDGRPDPSFGERGLALLGGEGAQMAPSAIHAMLRLPDGRIVVAGEEPRASDPGSQFSVARLLADGRLDGSWPRRSSPLFPFPDRRIKGGRVTRLALRPDGGLFVGGPFEWPESVNVGLFALGPDGSRETVCFFEYSLEDSDASLGGLAALSATTVLAAGGGVQGGSGDQRSGNHRIGFVRLKGGAFTSGWGRQDQTTIDLALDVPARDLEELCTLALLPSGKTLAAGDVRVAGNVDFFAARFVVAP